MDIGKRAHAVAIILLVLALGARQAQAQDQVFTPTPPADPLLLLHVSFDQDIDRADTAAGQAQFVPHLYDRSPLWEEQGVASWQRSKDYLAFRALSDESGRLGACLSTPNGKGHRFRALGNVSARRGTVAFWVRFGRALSTAHAPVFSVGGAGISCRVRYQTINGRIGSLSFQLKRIDWQPQRWRHIALVYDCCLGAKVYVDGAVAAQSSWSEPDSGWHTDELFPDVLGLAAEAYRGSRMPLAFDELRCYSEPLAAAEIALLANGKPLSDDPGLEPRAAPAVFRAHRLAELGWDLPGDLPAVESAAASPTGLRQVGVVTSRDVRCWRLGAVDGVRNTRWPTTYQGYSLPNGGLHLELERGARIDYIRLRGNFEGRVYRGEAIEEPPPEQALLALKSPGKFLRLRAEEPIRTDTLSFFRLPPRRAEEMDKLGRQPLLAATQIHELGLFRTLSDGRLSGIASVNTFALSSQPFEAQDRWVRWALQSQFEPLDRIALSLSAVAQGESEVIRLRALRHVHLFVPAFAEPTALTGVRLRLAPRELAQPTRLSVQIRNPVDISRFLLDIDVLLRPAAGAGAQMLDLTFDLQDFMIPPDQALWLTLTPEHDLDLAARATRVDILQGARDEALAEHVRNMLNFARDRFIHVSEPRPWGHVPLARCGERLLAFRQLNLALEDLKRYVPQNDKLFGLWAWTHPHETPDTSWLTTPRGDGVPAWAVYAKEAMKNYRAFALWWIDNRQIPSGLFGSNYGDDTDLINDWLSLGMICDPDGRIRESVRRIADYCWLEGPIMRGINRRHTDTLHAYEEGINAQPHLAQLHYGDPVYLERLMETTRTVRDELTYPLPGGRRFFKACWYGATHIDTEFERGTDILSNALLLHPALYLAYYSRNEGALRLLSEWAGTWCELQTQAWREHGVDGPFPIRAKYPTGEIVGTTDRTISGYGYLSVCLGLYGITGEEKYSTPARTWTERGTFSQRGLADWLALDPEPYRQKVLEIADAVDWAPLNPAMGDDSRCAYSYLAWLCSGERRYVQAALKNSWQRITVLFPMHTWAEQSADRVAVSKTLVDRLYLGGTPGYRNKLWPTHTVSWQGFSEEFAAWVLVTRADSLRVWVLNFEDKTQSGELRVWGLEPGRYQVRIGADANEDGVLDGRATMNQMPLARNVPIALTLPSKQLTLVDVVRRAAGTPLWPRPDVAVTTTDMSFDAERMELRFLVHNVGSASARDIQVTVLIDGKPAATHRIPELAAPNDLIPKLAALNQEVPAGARRVEVVLDADERIDELWEGNNRAAFAVPGP